LEKNIILHNGFSGEVDMVGSVKDVIWLLVTFIFLFIIDQVISFGLYYKERVLSYLMSFFSVFILTIGLAVIYYLTQVN